MIKLLQTLFILFSPLLLSSCIFDDDWTGKSENGSNQTASFTYHASEEVEVEGDIKGDFDGFMIHAGNIDLAESVSFSLQTRATDGTSSNRDLVGFISERPALDSGNTALAIANALTQKLSGAQAAADDNLSQLIRSSTVSEQTYAGLGAVSKQVRLSFSSAVAPTPTSLTLSLARLFGVNRDNGQVTNWPSPDSSETGSSDYVMYLTVVYVNQAQVVVMASVAGDELADDYTHLLRSSTTPTNVTLTGLEIEDESQRFVASGGGGLADFLFVIDNSPSMGSYQEAVRNAGEIFADSMESSGLDFHIGTITTDRTIEFRDSYQDGPFTTDLEEYKSDVTPGSGGSATERGIYNSEQALSSTALGDEQDGIVTLAGYPRTNAGLSVIILSDEESQYPGNFDPDNNLFIDRGYRVYAIVDPRDNNSSQYDELANSSGGSTADINSIENFPDIFQEIAILAGAASSRYSLDYTPIESSIAVAVNGEKQDRSNSNGWQYVIGSNAILFKGASIPGENDEVVISYNHLPVQTWWVEPAASSVDAKFRTQGMF